MRLAIVLGVSEYADPKNNLPACKNDTALVTDLLQTTAVYDDVLSIIDEKKTVTVKEKLVSFVEHYRGKEVEEVFFYYTGHGELWNDDFYFLLGDFVESRRNQTSLQNSELDGWLRELGPALAVKVVDACQAGVSYVKEPGMFQKYLQAMPATFKRCYFMFSSQSDESSYQDADLSGFTRSFARSIAEFPSTEIRYKDIIDAIADEFEGKDEQTPLFVIQANNTERFATITSDLRDAILKHIQPLGATPAAPGTMPAHKALLADLVARDAEDYCSVAELLERLAAIKSTVQDFQFGDEFISLFSIASAFLENLPSRIPQFEAVGKWLEEHDEQCFAKPIYKREHYVTEVQVPKEGLFGAAFGTETRSVQKLRSTVVGMELTQDVPYEAIRVETTPKFENLNGAVLLILFVFSKTTMRFFHLRAKLRPTNWAETEEVPNKAWITVDAPLKREDALTAVVKQILSNFAAIEIAPLKKEYLPAPPSDDGAEQTGDEPEANTEEEGQEEEGQEKG